VADAQESALENRPTFAGIEMKPVQKITINKDSDFWKSMQKAAELDADEAATRAAARARKETLERAEQRAAEKKAYLDSIRHYDKIEFKDRLLRTQIQECIDQRAELSILSSKAWQKQETLRKELQTKCSHDMVLEMRTTWEDEYGSYHDGHYERKCVECFLIEKSDYSIDSRSYSNGREKYHKLEKSQVVLLRKTVDGKEYELEFDDLKW
jgi:hypothetical protein